MRAANSTVDPQEQRRRLTALGKRRKKLRKMEEELAGDIRAALPDVRLASIPMEEAAQLLDLNRTTLYQVYLPDADDTPRARAA